MHTTEILKVLTDNGWRVIREDGTHKILRKGKNGANVPFVFHDKDLGAIQVRKLAKRFGVRIEAFFAPQVLPKPKPMVTLPESAQPTKPTNITTMKVQSGADLVFLPAKALAVDHRYQRAQNSPWVRELASKWDDRLLGILTVSSRDGGFWILEGQHRIAALMARGEAERKVPCLVFTRLTLKEEADIYLGRSTVRLQTMIAMFEAKVTAEDPHAMAINRIVREVYKLQIGQGGKNNVQAIGTLFRLEELGVLAQTFQVWDRAWGNKVDGTDRTRGPILLAIGVMIRYYGKLLNHDRLGDQLRPFTAPELLHMANSRYAAKTAKTSEPNYIVMVDVFRSLYNHRMKDNALPAPDLRPLTVRNWLKP
jgi:predicted RNA binding protein YcfA (HicA-like mRNA interferase family)